MTGARRGRWPVFRAHTPTVSLCALRTILNSLLVIIVSSVLITNLSSRYYYYPRFAGEVTEAEPEKFAHGHRKPGLGLSSGF